MTTTIITFYDAAWPPPSPPAADGVCIYIGGDTPHVWTAFEIARQAARYRLPIWVRSDPQQADPVKDAAACLNRLAVIGAPKGTLVALDVETAVDVSFVQRFGAILISAGYSVIVYGSMSTLFLNDAPNGWYWGADWTSHPHLAPGTVMTQYVTFSGYDLDLAKSTLPFWDTRIPIWQETAMQALPVIGQGASGPAVKTAQGLLIARGYDNVTVDGVFGPQTASMIRVLQSRAQIAVDGRVGPQTWPVLLGVQ